jgi:hypothetical protein
MNTPYQAGVLASLAIMKRVKQDGTTFKNTSTATTASGCGAGIFIQDNQDCTSTGLCIGILSAAAITCQQAVLPAALNEQQRMSHMPAAGMSALPAASYKHTRASSSTVCCCCPPVQTSHLDTNFVDSGDIGSTVHLMQTSNCTSGHAQLGYLIVACRASHGASMQCDLPHSAGYAGRKSVQLDGQVVLMYAHIQRPGWHKLWHCNTTVAPPHHL